MAKAEPQLGGAYVWVLNPAWDSKTVTVRLSESNDIASRRIKVTIRLVKEPYCAPLDGVK